jgi:hypothetical protein
VYTYFTTTLFFSNSKKKYSTPFYKYRVINYHLKYNKVLYKLFKILITEFIIKYNTSPKDTDIFFKNTNTSLIDL